MPFGPPPPLPKFLSDELPFTRRSYKLERGTDAGKQLHFIDHGKPHAPPVLLLHGNPTWSFLWRKVIALLPEFRCVAPDLLGLGFSDRLESVKDHTLERHVAAIAELVERLDLRDVILAGQDWGGPIGVGVAARLNSRFRGVVLGNTAVVLSAKFRGTRFHRFARMPVVSDIVFRLCGFPQNILHRIQGDPRSIRGSTARAYTFPLRRLADRIAPLALARMVPDTPEHPTVATFEPGDAWIREFNGPLVLVWGMRDPILGRTLRRHREALPRARIVETEAGHFLQEEVPEAMAQAVRDVARRSEFE